MVLPLSQLTDTFAEEEDLWMSTVMELLGAEAEGRGGYCKKVAPAMVEMMVGYVEANPRILGEIKH